MRLAIYDNGARRYYPPPSNSGGRSLLRQEDQQVDDENEDLVRRFVDADIVDGYYDGEAGVFAHRFRARPSLPRYSTRNQEHFAIWRTTSKEIDGAGFLAAAATDMKRLFSRPGWAKPSGSNSDEQKPTNPENIVRYTDLSEEASESPACDGRGLQPALQDGASGLRVGVSSFREAQRLFQQLVGLDARIAFGNFGPMGSPENIEADLLIEYDSEYDKFTPVTKTTRKTLADAARESVNDHTTELKAQFNERLNSFKEGSMSPHEQIKRLQQLNLVISKLPTSTDGLPVSLADAADAIAEAKALESQSKTLVGRRRRMHDQQLVTYAQRQVTAAISELQEKEMKTAAENVYEALEEEAESLAEVRDAEKATIRSELLERVEKRARRPTYAQRMLQKVGVVGKWIPRTGYNLLKRGRGIVSRIYAGVQYGFVKFGSPMWRVDRLSLLSGVLLGLLLGASLMSLIYFGVSLPVPGREILSDFLARLASCCKIGGLF